MADAINTGLFSYGNGRVQLGVWANTADSPKTLGRFFYEIRSPAHLRLTEIWVVFGAVLELCDPTGKKQTQPPTSSLGKQCLVSLEELLRVFAWPRLILKNCIDDKLLDRLRRDTSTN